MKSYELRTGVDLTQAGLAERIAQEPAMGGETLTQGAISRWYRGAVPPLDTIEAIAAALGVRAGWLAFGEGAAAAPVEAAPAEPAPPRPRAPQIPVEMYVPARTAERRAAAKQAEDEARQRRKRG